MGQKKTVDEYRREFLGYTTEERAALLQALVQTDWEDARQKEQDRMEGTCPHCNKYRGKDDIKHYPQFYYPNDQVLCSRCYPMVRNHYRKYYDVCSICRRYCHFQRPRSSHIPLCDECYTSHAGLWKRYHHYVKQSQDQGIRTTLTLPQLLSGLVYFDWKCAYCGEAFEALDHVIPRSRGGITSAKNILPVCTNCNSQKTARKLEQLRLPEQVLARIQHYFEVIVGEDDSPEIPKIGTYQRSYDHLFTKYKGK